MALNISLDAIKHLRKFDGKDFTTWKHNMEMMFFLKNLTDTVEVKRPRRCPLTYNNCVLTCPSLHRVLILNQLNGTREKRQMPPWSMEMKSKHGPWETAMHDFLFSIAVTRQEKWHCLTARQAMRCGHGWKPNTSNVQLTTNTVSTEISLTYG